MADIVEFEVKDNKATIRVGERFDFNVHSDFRSAYEKLDMAKVSGFEVDLRATKYMDSSALGMLLVFREHVGGRGKIELVNCRDEIRSILEVANFQKLFAIS
jgi:anti-anti-sigma factor